MPDSNMNFQKVLLVGALAKNYYLTLVELKQETLNVLLFHLFSLPTLQIG